MSDNSEIVITFLVKILLTGTDGNLYSGSSVKHWTNALTCEEFLSITWPDSLECWLDPLIA